MGLGRHTPFAVKSAIERAGSPEAVADAAGELPNVVETLVGASADPVDVGHVVALAIDAMTRRLLDLAIEREGEPPAPWAWLALGSAARREQALRTDQDHALVYDADPADEERLDPYFERIGAFVTDGLEAAGVPRCNGDVMASNRALRRTLAGWQEQFRTWMRDPGSSGSQRLSIAFDYRRVAGPLDAVPPLDEVVSTAPEYPIFVRHLGARALDERPPTGFVRDLVVESRGEHAGTLDVKHRGITIVTNLARGAAIARGLTAKRTLERLRAAAAVGALDDDLRDGLDESFRFLWEIRLRHHVRRLEAKEPVDDFVDPAELGDVARQGLKEAFKVIARAQRVLAADLGVHVR
jgi:CBS domain-containing protein